MNIRNLEREAVTQKAEISALSEAFNKLQEKYQERDRRIQTLVVSWEDTETIANNIGHTLSNLPMELEKRDEFHKTQLNKLGQDVERLQEDYEKELHETLSKLQTELKEKDEAHRAQLGKLRRDTEEARKGHEKELYNTKADFKKQCDNDMSELGRSNATVGQLQTDIQSLRDELHVSEPTCRSVVVEGPQG
jgi:chromosome segregation ATPase